MHIVIGANGLAKQALPFYNENPRVVFFDNTKDAKDELYSHHIIHDLSAIDEIIENSDWTSFSICIGNPKWRKYFFELLVNKGVTPINIFSDISSIQERSEIDTGNIFLDYSLVEIDAKIGKGNLINCYAGIFHDAQIGDFNEIMPGAKILGGAKIGNECRIGTNATILPQIEICSNVVIGAGAVVVKNITEPGTYVGVPATKVR
jgi:sugar O-acyltransferase (sialic acid O-acetyltransferase NeuD family)